MGQEQLSGGQAIRLSLAMLLACQQIILPEVGLLVLDEPSSHIDKEGVERMRDLFLSLQQVMTNTNMQILVVDHNDRLATAFETTVVL
jgi:energy-coupling factor transporter ATP-binding protein EcfA2